MERDLTSRSHHDMGGLDAGHIQYKEHDYEFWEKNVDAMLVLLTSMYQTRAARFEMQRQST